MTGLGVAVIDLAGNKRFASSIDVKQTCFAETFLNALECADAEQTALLYGVYQARRFGGRYIFLTPSGLTYCASPINDEAGILTSGAVAGPFLMTDHDEFFEIDVLERYVLDDGVAQTIARQIHLIPYLKPEQVRSVSELLYACVISYTDTQAMQQVTLLQTDAFSMTYSILKENDLLAAISIGDERTSCAILNDILGNILFSPDINMETLRLRVFELTVLLSRAALKGGADVNAIFGLNYSYLREIDALKTSEDAVLWLHNVTRRFARHVFEHAGSKHMDAVHKAISYIKNNYAEKITLQDVADSVYFNLTYFSKVFKDKTGQTPGNFITSVRIDASKRLLQDQSVNLIDIPEMVGFESQSYFTRVFKKAQSCTPAQYRRRNS
jgi:AraC-like DNA-binding protein